MFRISKAEGQALSFLQAEIDADLTLSALPTSRDKLRSSILRLRGPRMKA